MGKIKKLASHEIQKIAAGEVVERPANVVKELIENSIDAEATQITVRAHAGGQELIQIIDNGCGMDYVDARACFTPHATSKLSTVDELGTVTTHGFRGEALASVGAVSKVTLITKPVDTLEGRKIVYEFGKETTFDVIGCNQGTDITVQQVFENVPVRKKFLKKAETEWRHIVTLFKAYCLSYPSIHFKLYSEHSCAYNVPAAENLLERSRALWNEHEQTRLLSFEHAENNITVHGVISDHQLGRYDKQQIFFFVNKRFVRNYQLTQALMKGYQNVLQQGKFPLGCIMIELPSQEVDVNIHPRKEEVQFLHPRRLQTVITEAVKQRLQDNLSSKLQPHEVKSFERQVEQAAYQSPLNATQPRPLYRQEQNPVAFNPFGLMTDGVQAEEIEQSSDTDELFAEVMPPAEEYTPIAETQVSAIEPVVQEHNYRLIGQYHLTYLLVEKEEGLFLVDQHAAHERIMYEEFTQKLSESATVQLLFPQIIKLSPEQCSLLTPYSPLLNEFGVACELFGDDQLLISATPARLQTIDWNEMIMYLIAQIQEHDSIEPEELRKLLHHNLAAMMACKAAVKAGDKLSGEQMEQLLTDLAECPNRLTCPHGRPTGWLLDLYQIEKKFKRKL